MHDQEFTQQWKRLERHYKAAVSSLDRISMLDMGHVLRIWVDMKERVQRRLDETPGIGFPVASGKPKKLKRLLRDHPSIYIPFPGRGFSVGPSVATVFTVIAVDGPRHPPDEYARIIRLPTVSRHTKSIVEWLGQHAILCTLPAGTGGGVQPGQISREIFIKRIANILGPSHPASPDSDNRWDPFIRETHGHIISGAPATYFKLMEIARDALAGTRHLVQPD